MDGKTEQDAWLELQESFPGAHHYIGADEWRYYGYV